jgi:hypothetical protein
MPSERKGDSGAIGRLVSHLEAASELADRLKALPGELHSKRLLDRRLKE